MNRKFPLILSLMLCLSMSNYVIGQTTQKKKSTSTQSTPKQPEVKHTTGVVKRSVPVPKDTFVDIITNFGTMRVRLYKETPMHRTNFIKLASSDFYDSLLFHRVIKEFMIQGGDPNSKNAAPDAMLGNGDLGYRIPAEFNKKLYHKKGALAAARDNNPEMASSACQFYVVQGKTYTAQELSNIINSVNYTKKMMLLQEYTNRDSIKMQMADYNQRGDQDGLNKYMEQVKLTIDKAFEPMMYEPDAGQVAQYMTYGGAPHLDGSYTVFGEVISGTEVIDKIAAVQVNGAKRPIEDVRMQMKIVIQ